MAQTTTKKTEEVTEELIDYYAPISKKDQDDIKVCINGKWTIIKRGEHVKVTRAVYEVLMNKERMQQEAIKRSIELQQKVKEM